MKKTFIIIAGETSGDKHAAGLVRCMKEREDVRFVGIGGDEMTAAGVNVIHHVREMSVMGFSEVLSKLPFFAEVRNDLLRVVREQKPTAAVLVDFPGFNLRFAKLARREGLKVFYYVSPQVWAWGRRRIKTIRRTVDLMLTIFKFEEEMYSQEKVRAEFVGHPLLDEMKVNDQNETKAFRSGFVGGSGKLLALLPGSRLQEIRRILPTMLDAAQILRDDLRREGVDIAPVIGCAPSIDDEAYSRIVEYSGVDAHLSHDTPLLMDSADAGMVASGTATLEAALHNLPMLVAYRTSPLTYFIGKSLVKLKSISLVNIVAQQKIVEELVQNEFRPVKAAGIVKPMILRSEVSEGIRKKYAALRNILGEPGASERAAELILKEA